MSSMAKYQEAVAAAKAAKAQAAEVMKQAFTEAAKQLFDDFPIMNEFSWTQYTPYFNDGDPCTFDANVTYPEINGGDCWQEDDLLMPAKKAVIAFLSQFEQDDYETLFGDHVKVTVKRDVAEPVIDDYQHD